MEWMRCNACWLKAGAKQSLFHLTQCGHVYCDKCIMKAEKKCFQCGSEGTISLPLKEPFSPQIAHYFTQPTVLLEKVTQAQEFQESQLGICLKRADTSDSQYQSLKEAYWTTAESLKKLVQKYNKLKVHYNMLEKETQKSAVSSGIYTSSHFQTPLSQVNNAKSSQYHYYPNKDTNLAKRNNEILQVSSVTRAPSSIGYFTGSSTSTRSSDYRTAATPQSNYSRYRN